MEDDDDFNDWESSFGRNFSHASSGSMNMMTSNEYGGSKGNIMELSLGSKAGRNALKPASDTVTTIPNRDTNVNEIGFFDASSFYSDDHLDCLQAFNSDTTNSGTPLSMALREAEIGLFSNGENVSFGRNLDLVKLNNAVTSLDECNQGYLSNPQHLSIRASGINSRAVNDTIQNHHQQNNIGDRENSQMERTRMRADKISEDDEPKKATIDFLKAQIVAHPLYEQLLEAHVACLKVGTPVNQLPFLDLQLERSDLVAGKYLNFLKENRDKLSANAKGNDELTSFLAQFISLLRSFKLQLEEHVKVDAKSAVLACWELEQSFVSITGMKPGVGNGLTMSDEEQSDDEVTGMELNSRMNGNFGPYGPLIPTDDEKSIMDKMREELKIELKNGYRDKITDVREEIMRKRRAGKLPGNTTAVLKAWWNDHSKWPYPTEEEKTILVTKTGLELKQINNWFINQRKRNWNSGSSQAGRSSKRKQY